MCTIRCYSSLSDDEEVQTPGSPVMESDEEEDIQHPLSTSSAETPSQPVSTSSSPWSALSDSHPESAGNAIPPTEPALSNKLLRDPDIDPAVAKSALEAEASGISPVVTDGLPSHPTPSESAAMSPPVDAPSEVHLDLSHPWSR